MDRMRPTRKAKWRQSLYARTAADSIVATLLAVSLSVSTTYAMFHAAGYNVAASEICSVSATFVLPVFLYVWLSFIGVAFAASPRRTDVPMPNLTPPQS